MNNKSTVIANSSYTKMEVLLKEISKYGISKEVFVDKFFDIYWEIESKNRDILFKNWFVGLNVSYDKFVSLAIKKLIELDKNNEEEPKTSVFDSQETNQFSKDSEYFTESSKYEIFLKLLHKKYWLKLEWLEINTYTEELELDSSRKLLYKIITIKNNDISTTILINNQIWEDTHIYKWIIEPNFLSNISKWDELNGKFPISIKYCERFEKNLEVLLNSDFSLDWINSVDFKDPEHIKILLSNITDKNWNKLEIDLKTVWITYFKELFFWYWTVFWIVKWAKLLTKSWWQNNIILKKILKTWWVSRPDLPNKKLDHENPGHIKTLLSNITDKYWNNLEVDLKTIWILAFYNLCFWYWTEFWIVTWITILIKNWWKNVIYLKKFLESSWVPRPDLPSKDLDYKNPKHIKTLLSSITDKDWTKLDIDLKTIWVSIFTNLYFWYKTEFWILSWKKILRNIWWENKIYLKKLLEIWWISRPDLAKDDFDIKNPKNIEILLSNITESNWNKLKIDLNTVKVWTFNELYFWYLTEFWKVRWSMILESNWWKNNRTLKKILSYNWIKRPDLGIKKVDYKNPKHIKILLSSITDKDWNKLDTDLRNIWVTAFSKLHFWYGTEFWMFGWHGILYNIPWQIKKVSLKKLLEAWWISRPDL